MGRFAPLLPELILSIGGTILMLVAAFAGRRGSNLTSWLAVALLSTVFRGGEFIVLAIGLFASIIGIPFGLQHLKMALISFAPVGQEVVEGR